MAFKVLFLAHAPDAEPKKHQCVVETSKYKLLVRLVKNQEQAVQVCRKLVKEEGKRFSAGINIELIRGMLPDLGSIQGS